MTSCSPSALCREVVAIVLLTKIWSAQAGMRDNGGAAACGGAAGAAGARDGCALFRFASFLNAALAHAIGALWPALCPRARWAGPPGVGVVQPF